MEIKSNLKITVDGKPIVDVFEVVDTHGIPLEICLRNIKEMDMTFDAASFWKKADKAGWNLESTYDRIIRAYTEVYGRTPQTLDFSKCLTAFIIKYYAEKQMIKQGLHA